MNLWLNLGLWCPIHPSCLSASKKSTGCSLPIHKEVKMPRAFSLAEFRLREGMIWAAFQFGDLQIKGEKKGGMSKRMFFNNGLFNWSLDEKNGRKNLLLLSYWCCGIAQKCFGNTAQPFSFTAKERKPKGTVALLIVEKYRPATQTCFSHLHLNCAVYFKLISIVWKTVDKFEL